MTSRAVGWRKIAAEARRCRHLLAYGDGIFDAGLTTASAQGSATAEARVLAIETAISPYQAVPRLLGRERLVLLDSSLAGSPTGRYSYLTADPFLVVRSRGRRVEIGDAAGSIVLEGDPFQIVQRLLRQYCTAPVAGLPPFTGGAIGYFAYDLGRILEHLPPPREDTEMLPDIDLGFYDWVLAADHVTGQNWLIKTVFDPGAEGEARAEVCKRLEELAGPPVTSSRVMPAPQRLRSNVRRGEYLAAVRRAQEYIAAGDIYQVNLTHRLEGRWYGNTWPLYERLRAGSPVPYGAYLALGELTILSASPERFLRLDAGSGEVETRPIKGTRPRGATAAEDEALAADLAGSEKDRAENLMIVDLLRNDLGKVCQIGSVRVPELFRLEPYATVWQMVSSVTGVLRPEMDAVDLLRACFPGGSVTGCPKIRAMEIIDELEPARRGVYCGTIGYLSFNGAMDSSIVIRTLVHRRERVHLHVGGAIVADSDPAAEYAETIAKARAGLEALGAEVEEL